MPREPLTIVGGGLVGALLALMLARRGQDVVLYERRPDPRRGPVAAGRSINLALSTRGLHALHNAGIGDAALSAALALDGRMVHPLSASAMFMRYGALAREQIHSISRADLNRLLLDAAESTGRVRIHFGQRLQHYSFADQKAEFVDEATGNAYSVFAPVVFGTDGSTSALRDSMARENNARVEQEPIDCHYKELILPAAPSGTGFGREGRFALEPHALHIWPRRRFMLIALPNLDGSFTCTLFLAAHGKTDEPCFDALTEPARIEAFFAEHFPDVKPLLPNLAQTFLQAKVGSMGTVKTSAWSRGSAVLLGDAAHAMVPFFGQGMNAGFEDCATLVERWSHEKPQSAAQWAALFSTWWADRKPDTDAISALALENYEEMRHSVTLPSFLLRRAVESELGRRFPGEYVSRYRLVTFTRIPYRAAAEAGRLQDGILDDVCAGIEYAADVDYEYARALMTTRLRPLMHAYGLSPAMVQGV